jgi:hypothetical protein
MAPHFQIPVDVFERRELAALVDYRQPIRSSRRKS